jgi:hypothetical protein
VDYQHTEVSWEDRQGAEWFTRLWWAPIGGRLRCVGFEVRSFALPDDPEHARLADGAALTELTDTRLRGLGFGRLERETRQAQAFFARRAGLGDVELWQHAGGRGRPRLSDDFLATALDVANAARQRGRSQVTAVREWVQERWPERWPDPSPDNSTIGRWLTEARRRARKDGLK